MVHLKTILATNIKYYRKFLGLTQEKLAETVNTAPTYIAMIEAERRIPSFKMIERLAEALKVDAARLFSIENYPIKSTSELKGELLNKFDQFLIAAIKEIEEKN